MLSKKMAVSLTSLITLLAFAFVVAPAIAQDFDVSLDMTSDVSGVGDLQLVHPGTSLNVTVKFAEAVKLDAATVFVTTYDKDGKLVDIPKATGSPAKTVASKKITLTIPVTANVVKVNIRIAEGIVAADPLNDKKSKKLDANVHLVSEDAAGGPTVYSIRRADNPLLPIIADTVQVIITLSERPKEFKKGNVSVTDNATITKDPQALAPVAERVVTVENVTQTLIGAGVVDTRAPSARGLYDTSTGANDGIHYSIKTEAAGDDADKSKPIKDLEAAYTDYSDFEVSTTLPAGVTVAAKLSTDAIADYSQNAPSTTVDYEADFPLYRPLKKFSLTVDTSNNNVTSVALTPDITVAQAKDPAMVEAVLAKAEAAPGLQDRTTDPGAPPNPLTIGDPDQFVFAARLHAVRKEEYRKYTAEMALYDAYAAAVAAEQAKDQVKIDDYYRIVYGAGAVQRGTGRDKMLYPYVVTIAPKYPAGEADIVVKVNAFEDTFVPPNRYTPPDKRVPAVEFTENIDQLTIKVGKEVLKPGTAGTEVVLAKEHFIPKDGYLVVVDDADGSAIINPGGAKDAPPVTRSPAGKKYNLHTSKALPNLEGFLLNGGIIDVVSPLNLKITEIMWGTDASLVDDNSKSQWIELRNLGAGANTADDDANTAADEATRLIFYAPNETPPPLSSVKDRVGGLAPADIASRGQSGRTGVGEEKADLTAVVPTQSLISMRRMIAADGTYAPGTLATSWVASGDATTGLGINFKPDVIGRRIGSPGADHLPSSAEIAAAAAATAAKAAKAAADKEKIANTGTYPKAGQGRVYISEIMFAGGGTLPQWIEISNGDRSAEFNLSGWTITVANAVGDTDVSVGATAMFTIPDGTTIDPSAQDDTPSTILVVTEKGRNNLTGAKASGQVINLADNEVELILAGVVTGKYTLLSDEAFLITLAPPAPTPTKAPAGETAAAKATRQAAAKKESAERKAATDMVGNLGADGAAAWALPMNAEGGRSSIIRKHVQVVRGPAAPEDGMMKTNWVLASDTAFKDVTHIRAQSYYGAANDVGTPGFRTGGALPVELSHFRPARDRATGAAVITWSTQSELNNAGFYIKRSQQRNGEFKVINATMIAGAGTTSEKQFYTYTDTTAQPNVVYYYQIEDVSLDGNRQTLTRGIRLKGHVGAAGKATTTWGELKTSHE